MAFSPSSGTDHPNKLSAAMAKLKSYYASGDSTKLLIKIPEVSVGSDGVELLAGEQAPVHDVSKTIIDNLSSVILDNSEGAYFVKDMLKNNSVYSRFRSHEPVDISLPTLGAASTTGQEGVEQFVKIVYEPDIEAADGKNKSQDLPFFVSEALKPHTEAAASSLGEDATSASLKLMIRSRVDPGTANSFKTNFVVNSEKESPDRYESPTVAAFMMPNLRVCPQTRGSEAASIFCNSIPPVEMSRCIPMLKIKFASATPPTESTRKRHLSLLNFLGLNSYNQDGKTIKQESVGFEEALPVGIKRETGTDLSFLYEAGTGANVVSLSSAGMELFTSPQTLVNMNMESSTLTRNPVLDPTQPLMSLETFKVQIAGLGQDIHANKTGTMTFVLHDRSRMADIAPLIAADSFAQTYLVADYGWSHPDGENPDQNAFGALLNSLRSVSAFNIVSTTMNMGQDGQVRFTMKLASRGRNEIRMYPVCTGEVMPTGPMRAIIENYLAEKLRQGTSTQNSFREVRQKAMLSMGSTSANA